MIKPEQIPDEVVKAAISAYDYASSDLYTTQEQDMEAAIAAAINAWPGMEIEMVFMEEEYLILPLPKENSNERRKDRNDGHDNGSGI